MDMHHEEQLRLESVCETCEPRMYWGDLYDIGMCKNTSTFIINLDNASANAFEPFGKC